MSPWMYMRPLDLPPTISTTDTMPSSQVMSIYKPIDYSPMPISISNIFQKKPSSVPVVIMNHGPSTPSIENVELESNPSTKFSQPTGKNDAFGMPQDTSSRSYAPKQAPSLEKSSDSPSNSKVIMMKPTTHSQTHTNYPSYGYPPFHMNPSPMQLHSPPSLKSPRTTLSPIIAYVPTQSIPRKVEAPDVVDFLKLSSFALLGLVGFYAAYHIVHVLSKVNSPSSTMRNTSQVSGTSPAIPINDTVQRAQYETIRVLKERRKMILELLFPLQCLPLAANGIQEESIDKKILNQDINSESITSMNDNKDIMECSICLDYVDDSVMFGPCRHYYHRACIMEWMTDYHDECPTCRQRMWDRETFKAIENTMRKLGHI